MQLAVLKGNKSSCIYIGIIKNHLLSKVFQQTGISSTFPQNNAVCQRFIVFKKWNISFSVLTLNWPTRSADSFSMKKYTSFNGVLFMSIANNKTEPHILYRLFCWLESHMHWRSLEIYHIDGWAICTIGQTGWCNDAVLTVAFCRDFYLEFFVLRLRWGLSDTVRFLFLLAFNRNWQFCLYIANNLYVSLRCMGKVTDRNSFS